MKLIPALALAGILALGTTASVALTASHQAPATAAYVAWHESEPAPLAAPVATPTPVAVPTITPCQEDEPCWNCATMGNRICGPAPVAVAPVYVAPKPVPTITVTGVAVEPIKAAVTKQAPATAKPTPVATATPTPAPTVIPITGIVIPTLPSATR